MSNSSSSAQGSPAIVNSLLEFRAAFEACSLAYAYPWLLQAEPGEGRPVLVVPGFTQSDNATYFVRRYLKRLGYDVYGWKQGVNNGLCADKFAALEQRLSAIHRQTATRVALIGWSLGGFYVRALANKHSAQVSGLMTVGTTFSMPTPRAVNRGINRLYGQLNPYQQMDGFFQRSDLWESRPPMPSSSIYSKGDGVNNWRFCLDAPSELSENIQVWGSYSGMAVNPMVYHVLADRLGQLAGHWQPYQRHRLLQRAMPLAEET